MFIILRKRNIAWFLSAMLFFGVSWSGYHLAMHPAMKKWQQENILVSKIDTEEKVVALTYDDGPDPVNTPAVLDALKKHKAQATFFVLGKRVAAQPEIIKRMKAEGHEIGSHGYSHPDYNKYKKAGIADDIIRTSEAIRKASGDNPSWFRPPGGYLSYDMVDICREHNLTIAYWTYQQDSKDWRNGVGAGQIAGHITRHLEPGQIIVLHDGAPNGLQTAKATDLLLSALKKQGYRVVTMSELIKAGKQ
ncbi:MAG: polysaccharide deacetylase family protein [Syntrophomonadaceae bacterium]|nr:polysaccharide deacetylase family protein [Syntrophomonadaceae bacterium]